MFEIFQNDLGIWPTADHKLNNNNNYLKKTEAKPFKNRQRLLSIWLGKLIFVRIISRFHNMDIDEWDRSNSNETQKISRGTGRF